MRQLLVVAFTLLSTIAISQTRIGTIYRLQDNGSARMSREPYYGGAVKYGAKPIFIVYKRSLIALPILSFEAEKKGSSALLSWKASGPVDVQKSKDGSNYETIAKDVDESSMIDRSPFVGKNFYRIKLGQQYSEVRTLTFEQAPTRYGIWNVLGQYFGETQYPDEFIKGLPRYQWYIIIDQKRQSKRVFNP
jgi:hypothetical protein